MAAIERCPHGRYPEKCAPCVRGDIESRFPRMVWITEKGDAFHAVKYCEGVINYQRWAAAQGMNTYEPREITAGEALFTLKRTPCEYCFSTTD